MPPPPNLRFRPRRREADGDGQMQKRQPREDDPWSHLPTNMTPDDIDAAFRELIEETLPPDKQEALWESYEAEPDYARRYHMLLEFSSFLRQARCAGPAAHAARLTARLDRRVPRPEKARRRIAARRHPTQRKAAWRGSSAGCERAPRPPLAIQR